MKLLKNHITGLLFGLAALCLMFSSVLCPCRAEALELPEDLKEVGEDAFRGDTSLSEVILPDGVTSIGAYAFAYSSVMCVNLPDSLIHIDPTAFEGCEDVFCLVSDENSAAAAYCRDHGIPYEVQAPSAGVRHRALIIGESHYIQTLMGPDNDAACMEQVLNGLGNWQVISQTDCTRDEIMMLVDLALGDADDNDVSLFYYSGHGVTGKGDYYAGALQTVDNEYILMQELADALSQVAGRVIVILDSCGSGAAIHSEETNDRLSNGNAIDPVFDPGHFNSGAVRVFGSYQITDPEAPEPGLTGRSGELRQNKFVVLTASGYEENSRTILTEGVWGSVMTRALTEGLGCRYPSGAWNGTMPADTDLDSALTLRECCVWCSARAAEGQHVTAWPMGSGLLLFDRGMAQPELDSLPVRK